MCANLREVTFEKGSNLAEIGSLAFWKSNLARIEIPSKCEFLTGESLADIPRIAISIENPFFAIERSCVVSRDGKRLVRSLGSASRVLIRRNFEMVDAGCFSGRKSLRDIAFEEGCTMLRQIGDSAFRGTGLQVVTLPASVEVIGHHCFHDCRSLCDFTFEVGSKIREIGRAAFSETGLRTVTIPGSVEVIGAFCFCSCGALCGLAFEKESNVKEIGRRAFHETGITTIEIPPRCENLTGGSVIGVKCVTISEENPFFVIEDSFARSRDGKRLIRYLGSESQVLIKSEVEEIAEECFADIESLSQITFEEGSNLRLIRQRAFARSGLEKLAIPPKVEVIEEWWISGCSSLREVWVQGNIPTLPNSLCWASTITDVRVPRGARLDVYLPKGCKLEYMESDEK
jgi:hypothetical protein